MTDRIADPFPLATANCARSNDAYRFALVGGPFFYAGYDDCWRRV
jgi:hypothetical protein